MRILFFTQLFAILTWISTVYAQSDSSAQQLKAKFEHEAFTVNALIQSGFRYSLADDTFQGGRTFEAANARLSFRGIFDDKFYYRIFYNLVGEPNLLDAFVGYRHSERLRISAGAMKPKQTQDYIPDPGSTDFIDRTHITGLLVQSREIGVSAEGDINGLYYFTGLFNGTKLRTNNNNSFYGIARVQFTIKDLIPGTLQMALHGSHGNSPNVRSGSSGPRLLGERTIYGIDARWETDSILLAAEYLAGHLETVDYSKEQIIGYYVTVGYNIINNTMVLGRWQSWGSNKWDYQNQQLTVGMNHSVSAFTSIQLNIDSYFPENDEQQHGLSFLVQIQL